VPKRALGLAHAAVDPGARQLAAQLEVPDASDPRAALPVALKVTGGAAGETVYATIAAVDLGILNLTGFKAPDPSAHYFGQRRLGMALRDVYGRLIDGQNGAEGIIRSGGDAAAGLKMQSPPPTEELVAYFSGPLTLDGDGVARTEFQMPAFNGTVRLMAVVWSASAVGQASADVLVRDPVVLTASVPRVSGAGRQHAVAARDRPCQRPLGADRAGSDLGRAGAWRGAFGGGSGRTGARGTVGSDHGGARRRGADAKGGAVNARRKGAGKDAVDSGADERPGPVAAIAV